MCAQGKMEEKEGGKEWGGGGWEGGGRIMGWRDEWVCLR